MQLVFCILAHDDPDMLAQLVSKLNGFDVLIHIDASVDIETYVGSRESLLGRNVTLVLNRERVHWGGFSAVRAMASFSNYLTNYPEHSSIVLLSGHCYPIRPIREFHDYLAANAGVLCRAYRVTSLSSDPDAERIHTRHWFDAVGPLRDFLPNSVVGLVRRFIKMLALGSVVESPFTTYVGSQWFAMPLPWFRTAATRVLEPEYAYLRNAYAPDEMAFHTVLYNSTDAPVHQLVDSPPAKVSLIPNFHYMRESMRGYLNEHDFPAMAGSGMYFARKVHSGDAELIRMMDELVLRRNEE